MTLDELSVKYETDKGSRGHWYTLHYERIFGPIKLMTESVLEVGVGGGASLRMWRDYFEGAMIYAVDMNRNNDMGARIVLYECEQTDCDKLYSNLHDKNLEIIVDDASHEQDKTIKTLDCLFPLLESKGWYVIEDMDVHSFPSAIAQWYSTRPEEIRELRILKNRSGDSLITFIKKK